MGRDGTTNSVLQICPSVTATESVLSLGPRTADGCEGGEFDVVPGCVPWIW